MAAPLVNEFYDKALAARLNVTAASLRRVDLVLVFHSAANIHVLDHAAFTNPCDRFLAGDAVLAALDDFLARHDRKVMLPAEIDESMEELDNLLVAARDIGTLSQQTAQLDLRLSPLRPVGRAALLEALPLVGLKEFCNAWEADRARPLLHSVKAKLGGADNLFIGAAFFRAASGADKAEAALIETRLKTSYRPVI